MLMFKALRRRPIALLWCGQATSAIGDEIYRVALIWFAVNLIGPDTGYLSAAQCAALLGLSLVGGKWADHWDHLRTMIWVDGLRAAIVLVPVIVAQFMPPSLAVLVLVAVLLSGLSAFFDPALQATIPRVCTDLETLKATNGLMSTTVRLARTVGPGIVALLAVMIPTIHFFTVDALTFAVSATSITLLLRRGIARQNMQSASKPVRMGFKESIISGFSIIKRNRVMRYVTFVKGFGGGIWALGYILGLALFVQKIAPGDVRAFGWTIASYGCGNLSAALILGNLRRSRPASLLFCGYIWLGLGFIWVGLAPSLHALMAAAAFSGFGGLMNDLPFVDLMQDHYSLEEIPKIFRLRIALETFATLVVMLLSPMIYRAFSAQTVIGACGVIFLFLGSIGFLKFGDADRSLPIEVTP
jgi:DHA3 family macrolide efflux protein-like MFS transporter